MNCIKKLAILNIFYTFYILLLLNKTLSCSDKEVDEMKINGRTKEFIDKQLKGISDYIKKNNIVKLSFDELQQCLGFKNSSSVFSLMKKAEKQTLMLKNYACYPHLAQLFYKYKDKLNMRVDLLIDYIKKRYPNVDINNTNELNIKKYIINKGDFKLIFLEPNKDDNNFLCAFKRDILEVLDNKASNIKIDEHNDPEYLKKCAFTFEILKNMSNVISFQDKIKMLTEACKSMKSVSKEFLLAELQKKNSDLRKSDLTKFLKKFKKKYSQDKNNKELQAFNDNVIKKINDIKKSDINCEENVNKLIIFNNEYNEKHKNKNNIKDKKDYLFSCFEVTTRRCFEKLKKNINNFLKKKEELEEDTIEKLLQAQAILKEIMPSKRNFIKKKEKNILKEQKKIQANNNTIKENKKRENLHKKIANKKKTTNQIQKAKAGKEDSEKINTNENNTDSIFFSSEEEE